VYDPLVLRLLSLAMVCAVGCQFDASGVPAAADDAAPPTIDADPNPPDASQAVEVELVRADPIGDGTPVAFIAHFANRVYVGPSSDGTSLMRLTYDGSGRTGIDMSFPGDANHTNSSTPPYPGIGYNGCTDDIDCGPNNENRRGFMASGLIAGTRWLVLGGAQDNGSIDHIYMTSDTNSSAVDMLYVGLRGLLGGSTEGLSAIHFVGDHIYLGFSDTGGARPYLLDLIVTPTAPGFDDVAEGTDAFDLDADDMPGLGADPGPGSHAMIDVITSYNGRLQFGNDGGWLNSRDTQHPPPYLDDPTKYGAATPDSALYSNKTSLATSKTGDLLPADRAVPNMVEYQGFLYAARNTTIGPQLWRCDPQGTDCAPGDWTLIAPNTTVGDMELCQFDNPNNTSITLLETTGTHLYVGFDNAAEGVVLYRTDVAAPTLSSDFQGDGGCTAGAGCAGLAGNGFGRAENKQFLDSEPIDVGGGTIYVYAAVGDTIAPLELYRFRGAP
jgi:hypothetical protein